MIRAILFLALCATALSNVIRFNAGGPELPNVGYRAVPAIYESAGATPSIVTSSTILNGGSWEEVYKSLSESATSDLVYTFPIPNGDYSIFLLFAETNPDAVPGFRQFSISINGDTKMPALDVVATAGVLNKALFLPYSVTVTNNELVITLGKIVGKNNPMISGIVITGLTGGNPKSFIDGVLPIPSPTVPAAPSTIASAAPSAVPTTNAASVVVTPSASVSAAPGLGTASCVPFDVLVNVGGPAIAPYSADDPSLLSGIPSNVFTTTQAVNVSGVNTAPAGVYNSERFLLSAGNSLTFTIPVTGTGAVTVETHHAETVFSAINKRVMGVSVNGAVKIASLDVFSQVGQNVALVNTFPNEVPSGGSVTVSFTRQTQNPQVNAIRVFRTCVGPPTVSPAPSVSAAAPISSAAPSVSSSVVPSVSAIAHSPSASPSLSAAPIVDSTACAPLDVLINVGGPAIAPYSADDPSLLSGILSDVFTTTQAVNVSGVNTAPAGVYNSERFLLSAGNSLTFTIPVTGTGAVNVETHHAETVFSAINKRVMGVSVNGAVKIASLDVFSQVGQNVALVNTFPNEVPSGGSVTVSFTRQTQNPQVNAIRIFRTCGASPPTVSEAPSASPSVLVIPSVSAAAPTAMPSVISVVTPAVTPIITPTPSVTLVTECVTGRTTDAFNMNVGSSVATGSYGAENVNYISGAPGIVYVPPGAVTVDAANTAPAGVYKSERFTFGVSLTYKIPVSGPGPFTVTTLHAEQFINAVGGRTFNILINGALKKTSLDIFSEVGMNVALPQVFANISPVAGEITISFGKVGLENPQVNAIRITGVGADAIAIAGGCVV